MNKVYVAGGASYILPNKSSNTRLYQRQTETSNKLIWLSNLSRSTDVPPANHKVWRELKHVFAEVNSMSSVDYDDSWLADLRSGSSERIKRFYESEDW